MWILLTEKLPTEISPPKMSIHWAGANAADLERMREQFVRSDEKVRLSYKRKYSDMAPLEDHGNKYLDVATCFGYEPKEDGAVWIIFDSEPIKVWPHEYTAIKPENFELYLNGAGDDFTMSHFPMWGRTALYADPQSLFIQDRFSEYPRLDRTLYDAARIDGQNELQAFYTAVEGYPLDLWFALGSHYAGFYGLSENDMMARYKNNEVYAQIKSGWQEEIGE